MRRIILLIISMFCIFSCDAQVNDPFDINGLSDKNTSAINGLSDENIAFMNSLKSGWNLGNTLDATGKRSLESEISWDMPYTTKEMIDGVASAGFKLVRVPVSWSNHIIDDKYTIDPAWMARVKQVVDWCIEDGMYVIINDHHDNCEYSPVQHCQGYYPNPVSWNESLNFVKNIWKQVSASFNNYYDEHLIFEILNEPRLRGHNHEWSYNMGCNECRAAASQINKLNRSALNVIRQSGGNNAARYVMISGIAASPDSYLNDDSFVIPEDTAKNRLIVSVHLYRPYSFAMENPGETKYISRHQKEIVFTLQALSDKFCARGIPVIIGEYGATNKNNTEDRIKWFRDFNTEAKKHHMVTCLWDNGQWDASNTYEEKFGFYDRSRRLWIFPGIVNAIMSCY